MAHSGAGRDAPRSRRVLAVVSVCAAGVVVAALGAGIPVARAVARHDASRVAPSGASRSAAMTPSSPATATASTVATSTTDPSATTGGAPAAASSGGSTAAATTSGGDHAGVPVGTAVAYPIPDLVTSVAAVPAAPVGQWQLQDLGQYRLEPVVPGQACSSRPPFNVAGRQWSWYRAGWASVDVSVTRWRTGRGRAAFDDVVQNAGTCRFTDVEHPVSVSVPAAAQAWAATSSLVHGVSVADGAALVGDVVIGVEITDAGSRGVGEVTRLLQAVATEMVADDLPAATSS